MEFARPAQIMACDDALVARWAERLVRPWEIHSTAGNVTLSSVGSVTLRSQVFAPAAAPSTKTYLVLPSPHSSTQEARCR
jgi:hypothetical protein